MNPVQYVLFFDVDGTITKIPGYQPGSLFDWYMQRLIPPNEMLQYEILSFFREFTEDPCSDRDHNTTITNFEETKNFLKTLTEIPETQIKIVFITNNEERAIKLLWTKAFGLPWERIDPQSYYRQTRLKYPTKAEYLAHWLNTYSPNTNNTNHRFMFFDDDIRNFPLPNDPIFNQLRNLRNIHSIQAINRLPEFPHFPNIQAHHIYHFLESNFYEHPQICGPTTLYKPPM